MQLGFHPAPKPPPREKQTKPLRRTRLKSKYNPDPFPTEAKKIIWERQNGICAHPGCNKEIEEYHHCNLKKAGGSKAEWIHDLRNGTGLCWYHHEPTIHSGSEATHWKLYHEARNVAKFGWWRGQDISLTQWLDTNEYRLQKANIDMQELLSELQR